MPLNPNIALQVKGLEVPNPLAQMAQVTQIQNALQQQRMGDIQMQNALREQSRQRELESIMSQLSPTAPVSEQAAALHKRGYFQQAQALIQQAATLAKTRREEEDARLKALTSKLDLTGRFFSEDVKDQATYDVARERAIAAGLGTAAEIPEVFDPAIVARVRNNAMSIKDQLAARQREREVGARETSAQAAASQAQTAAQKAQRDRVPMSVQEFEAYSRMTPEQRAEFTEFQANKRPTTTVNIEDKAGIAPFITSLARERDAVRAIPNQLENIQYAKSLIPEARAFMGPGGEPLLQTAGFLKNRLGFQLPGMEANVPAEKLRSALFEGVLQNLRQVDAQPTQKQQDALQAAIGKIGTDPDALGGILDQLENKLRSRLRQFNKDASAATASGFKFPFPIEVQEPAADQGAGGKRGSAPSGGAVLRFNERGEPIQ